LSLIWVASIASRVYVMNMMLDSVSSNWDFLSIMLIVTYAINCMIVLAVASAFPCSAGA